MNVAIKVLDLPELIAVFGERTFSFTFSGETLNDLLQALLTRFGPTLSRVLFYAEGQFNKTIQIIIKGKLCAQHLDRPITLQEGDQVVFVAFLEGG
ncbi:MAG: hypothetical protein C0407_04950 [Desulfobacca sp.]|nr:hypothetical protein [Desulfobacca sp.]